MLLGVTQTLAWASSYYLPAILADAIGKDVGASSSTVFGAFSVALLMSAAIGPFAGKLIDRRGGPPVLIASNLVFAAGLAALSQAQQPLHVFAAWATMGLAMGSGLYEAAFATAVRLHGQQARRTITGITLFAGFASTVGWPLTAWLESSMGWRGACLVWAGLHVVIGLPLRAMLPAADRATPASKDAGTPPCSASTACWALPSCCLLLCAACTRTIWDGKLLRLSLQALNIGRALMALLTLLHRRFGGKLGAIHEIGRAQAESSPS